MHLVGQRQDQGDGARRDGGNKGKVKLSCWKYLHGADWKKYMKHSAESIC